MNKVSLIFLLISCFLTSLKVSALKVGYLTTWENENAKIEIYQFVRISYEEISTYDANGKSLKFKNKNIKSVSAEGHEFRSLPINGIHSRLVEVIATSGKYILAEYVSDSHSWLIFDLQGIPVIKQTPNNTDVKFKGRTVEKIKPYFGDCEELMEKLEANMKVKRKHLFQDIYNYDCE